MADRVAKDLIDRREATPAAAPTILGMRFSEHEVLEDWFPPDPD